MKRLTVFGALVFLAVGCDSGPSGPGDITGTIQSPGSPLGGAVVEIVSSGIEGFSGAGGTRIFSAIQENPVVYRVIVIGESGGDLTFRVSVQDRGGRLPRASVVSLVDLNNLPLPVTEDYVVRFTH